MTTSAEWLVFLALCALLGATGQAARAIVGLKKMRDDAASKGLDSFQEFRASTLAVSLMIGAVAGVVAGLALGSPDSIDQQFALGIMAAGYAGTDFIEGFMSREASKFVSPPAFPGSGGPAGQPPAVG